MKRRMEMTALVLLLLVLGVVFYLNFRPSGSRAAVSFAGNQFAPVNVDNPALRLDVLKRFQALQYRGVHRNIFSATLPPPPAPPKKQVVNLGPAIPSGPPPLTVDAKYFGYVSDTHGDHRRAFFSTNNNEKVYIAGEGDTLMGRFRVVRLTNKTAEIEEIATGRTVTLAIENPPSS